MMKSPQELESFLQNTLINNPYTDSISIGFESNSKSLIFFDYASFAESYASFYYSDSTSELPEGICKFSELEFLKISYLGLQRLPPCLYELKKLNTLDVSYNKFQLEDELELLSRLPKLNTLIFYGYRIPEYVEKELSKRSDNRITLRWSIDHIKEDSKVDTGGNR